MRLLRKSESSDRKSSFDLHQYRFDQILLNNTGMAKPVRDKYRSLPVPLEPGESGAVFWDELPKCRKALTDLIGEVTSSRLAKVIDATKTHFNDIENGHAMPSAKELDLLLAFFEMFDPRLA